MAYLIKTENGYGLDMNVEERLISYEKLKVEMELIEKEIKEEIKELIEKNEDVKLDSDKISVSHKPGYVRKGFDDKKLKEDMFDVYERYVKEINVSDSISLKFDI